MRLQGRLSEDAEWTDLGSVSIDTHLDYYKGLGWKVKRAGLVFQLINPLSKKVDAEYREAQA